MALLFVCSIFIIDLAYTAMIAYRVCFPNDRCFDKIRLRNLQVDWIILIYVLRANPVTMLAFCMYCVEYPGSGFWTQVWFPMIHLADIIAANALQARRWRIGFGTD